MVSERPSRCCCFGRTGLSLYLLLRRVIRVPLLLDCRSDQHHQSFVVVYCNLENSCKHRAPRISVIYVRPERRTFARFSQWPSSFCQWAPPTKARDRWYDKKYYLRIINDYKETIFPSFIWNYLKNITTNDDRDSDPVVHNRRCKKLSLIPL